MLTAEVEHSSRQGLPRFTILLEDPVGWKNTDHCRSVFNSVLGDLSMAFVVVCVSHTAEGVRFVLFCFACTWLSALTSIIAGVNSVDKGILRMSN